jgi:hypothetical protein
MRAAGGQARSRVYQPSRLFKIALTAGLTLRQFFYPTNRTELGVFRCVHVPGITVAEGESRPARPASSASGSVRCPSTPTRIDAGAANAGGGATGVGPRQGPERRAGATAFVATDDEAQRCCRRVRWKLRLRFETRNRRGFPAGISIAMAEYRRAIGKPRSRRSASRWRGLLTLALCHMPSAGVSTTQTLVCGGCVLRCLVPRGS